MEPWSITPGLSTNPRRNAGCRHAPAGFPAPSIHPTGEWQKKTHHTHNEQVTTIAQIQVRYLG